MVLKNASKEVNMSLDGARCQRIRLRVMRQYPHSIPHQFPSPTRPKFKKLHEKIMKVGILALYPDHRWSSLQNLYLLAQLDLKPDIESKIRFISYS